MHIHRRIPIKRSDCPAYSLLRALCQRGTASSNKGQIRFYLWLLEFSYATLNLFSSHRQSSLNMAHARIKICLATAIIAIVLRLLLPCLTRL